MCIPVVFLGTEITPSILLSAGWLTYLPKDRRWSFPSILSRTHGLPSFFWELGVPHYVLWTTGGPLFSLFLAVGFFSLSSWGLGVFPFIILRARSSSLVFLGSEILYLVLPRTDGTILHPPKSFGFSFSHLVWGYFLHLPKYGGLFFVLLKTRAPSLYLPNSWLLTLLLP